MTYKYTAVPTGNLDQRWGHGIWVGKAPMTDEHNILTESGVQKARSLHRVPPEERFVISELKKVRGLPWEGRAETLKATIVTQQDQGPPGHRRVYLTTKVVARFVWSNAWLQWLCRIGTTRHWLTKEASAGPVGAGVGPIAELAIEPQPAPAAQQEPASSSSGPALPMPTQNLQNEQLDSPMEMVAQERRERKGTRPSETPSSEISESTSGKGKASVTTNDRADGGRLRHHRPFCCSIVQQGRDDDRWVVRDRWNRRCGNSRPRGAWSSRQQRRAQPKLCCGTESRNRFYEDPSTSETIEAQGARTGERLESEEVRKGRAKEVRELDEFEVKMEVDESEMRVAPGKKFWSKWVETRKDPNSPAIRCRLCATEVNTGEPRSDTFLETLPLKFVRLVLSWAASYQPKRANASMIIAVFDTSVAFFHGTVRKVIYVVPPKDLRKKVNISRLLKSLYGTRDASQLFATYVEEGLNEHGFQRNAVVPCLYWRAVLEALGVHWGDEFSLAFQMTGQTILSN